jgi:CHAP domain-containing protein
MMLLHDKVVEWAKSEIGTQEIPLGSNRGPKVEWYQSHDWLAGVGYPWCVCFFLTAWAEGAHKPLPIPTPGAHDFFARYKKLGWAVDRHKVTPGDAVIWNVGSGHLSMFLRFEGNIVVTVDGNVSDRVMIRKRNISLVRGFIHVPEVHVAVAPKIPLFTVTTSVNGHRKMVLTRKTYKAIAKVMPKLVAKYNSITITRSKK